MLNKISNLNPRQWQLLYQSMLAMSGPTIKVLSLWFGFDEHTMQAKVDALTNLLTVATPMIGMVWMLATSKNSDQFKSVAAMPDNEKAVAAAQLPPQALASIATSFPDEAKVASIIAMPAEAVASAVADLSTVDQAAVAASLPDKAIVTAAGLMDGVNVVVSADAPAGAKEAAHDPNVPGVNPA